MAEIDIIIGPMFSGKSTELIRRLSRFEAVKMPALYINHTLDSRTDNYIETHNKERKTAVKTHKLTDLLCNKNVKIENYKVIGIDEAQFFPDLKEFLLKIEHNKIHIVIAGLDGDFNRNPFGQILECIPLCNSVTKLNALDMDSKDGSLAPFSKRIVSSEEKVLVGATDKYIAVNRENFLK